MRSLVLFLLISIAYGEDGSAIYKQRCAGCHDNGVGRAPRPDAFKLMSPESVQSALTNGMMMMQGVTMTNAEIRSVAEFVTAKAFGGEALTETSILQWHANPGRRIRWLGRIGMDGERIADNHRFQPAAMAGLTAEDVPKLKLAWAFGIPGTLRAYGQPTVAGGRVFIGTGIAQSVFAGRRHRLRGLDV